MWFQKTGGGQFFLDLAFSLMGKQRGGPAKVAIFSSGLMGSMSGSVVTNVMTTGQLTIPAMKNSGMRAETAGAVEACASTGGVLLPPIMGSTAFVMASFLIFLRTGCCCCIFLQCLLFCLTPNYPYAGREGLKGIDEDEIPQLISVLDRANYSPLSFYILLLVLQQEAVVLIGSLALIVLSLFSVRQDE